ncbi:hypothetical protein [Lewinella sp. IMCC34183]|uniref:hypothetical protein n=1 Tax=Lewinella sp. IMCC34183 TaxID=2248762 RepID=UPI0018E50CCD|nr:hypothetical protein [Lewinella sp. IMCC34183]
MLMKMVDGLLNGNYYRTAYNKIISDMLLKQDDLPPWFEYPDELNILIKQKLLDFDPWIILTGDRLKLKYQGILKRYPNRALIPFARREDNDDVACFEKVFRVVIIHDFASSGSEGGENGWTFWEWFKKCIDDMIEYNS